MSLPENEGVYLFKNKEGEVVYVGKAKNLKKRVSSYFNKTHALGEKTRALVSQVETISVIRVESELESLLLEANLIKKHLPRYNIRLTDGKAYPLIRITIKETYPSVLLTRNMDDKNSVYFGPYPSSKTVKQVLKIMRRIFPFQSTHHHDKRLCLYNHLGLCPCSPMFDSKEFRKTYRKTINYLISFLEGNTAKVIKELRKERDMESKNQEFEQAKNIQKKIEGIIYITSPIHRPFEYEINPNLRVDLREKELKDLKKELEKKGVTTNRLERIECFDISNTSGTNAVGSMVTFVNGEKASEFYRRFKIKFVKDVPNDFAMMHEILQRRIKHLDDWGKPDLIIVDGGKGQISSAMKALVESGITIPLVGLAKREETIITTDFLEISLHKDSEALHLVQRIRDEAHRFAITYHKKLRSKFIFS